jgi:hypothetical protein
MYCKCFRHHSTILTPACNRWHATEFRSIPSNAKVKKEDILWRVTADTVNTVEITDDGVAPYEEKQGTTSFEELGIDRLFLVRNCCKH